MRQLRKRVAGRFSFFFMETITNQQISLIISQTASIISAFFPLVLVIGGIYLGNFILSKVRDMFVGDTTSFYDAKTNSVIEIRNEDIAEFNEELDESSFTPLENNFKIEELE